jgi:hypothetical protein
MPEYYYSKPHNAWVKECPRCKEVYIGGETQAIAERNFTSFFRGDRDTRDGYYSVCKTCVSRYQRSNRGGRRCEPDELLAQQNGKCGICEKPISFDKVLTRVTAYVDHNHDTNKVRGVLCPACNSMLRSKDWLIKALAYLARHGE